MANDRGIVREIAWREVFPVLRLSSAVRLATRFRMLFLAALGMLTTMFGWWLVGMAFSGATKEMLPDELFPEPAVVQAAGPATGDGPPRQERRYWLCPWKNTEQGITGTGWSGSADVFAPPSMGRPAPQGPFLGGWLDISAPFRQLFLGKLTITGLAYLLLCGLWTTAVWALFGGAITRIAAMQFGREESIGLKDALLFAGGKWLSFFASPLLPLLGVLLFSLPLVFGGLLLRLDWGVFVASVFWPLMLVAGLLMAIFLLGLIFGWPLMWGAISSEGTDSFDALSRSYSYVYQRPFQYLGFAIAAVIIGQLGWELASRFAEAVIHLTTWALSWGSGSDRVPEALQMLPRPSENLPKDTKTIGLLGVWGRNVIGFWWGFVRIMALGFIYSFFWVASTQIYLLLRKSVDGTELDEIYVDDLPKAHGVPPIVADAAGVQVVVAEEQAAPSAPDAPKPE